MIKSNVGRREFLQTLGMGAIAGATLNAQGPRAVPNVTVVAPNKGLLTSADMNYRGMWRLSPLSGASDQNLDYSRGPITFRRVNGELRLLVVGKLPIGSSTAPHPGPLMEFRMPTDFGSLADTAPEMQMVRSWGSTWASGFYTDTNGVNIGGMWFDHDWNVLWYTIYATYGGPNDPPFLGATRLNDDGTVTKFGPWQHPRGSQYYRMSSWWIYEAPASVKAVKSDAEMCLGGAVGSTAAMGNYGPGLYWFKRPALTSSGRLSDSQWGPLMGYHSFFGSHPEYFCKRSPDYKGVYPGAGGYAEPRNGVGYWIASLDQMSGHVWIEGSAKRGIATFGRMVRPNRYIWYPNDIKTRGGNPHTYNGVTYYDPGSSQSNSYKAGVIYPSTDTGPGTEPAMLMFNPAHPLEILAGKGRKAYDVRYYERANWQQLWNLPLRPGTPGPYGLATYPNPGSYQVFDSPQGQPSTSTYDRATQRVIWLLPATYNPGPSRYPTLQVWDVNA